MTARPLLWSALSLLLVAGLCVVYATLEPRYRLADQAPDREQAVKAAARLDAQLSGANPVHVLVDLPTGQKLYDAGDARCDRQRASCGRDGSGRRQRVVAGDAARVARGEGRHERYRGAAEIRRAPAGAPDPPLHRSGGRRRCRHGRIPDVDASQLLPVIDRLEHRAGRRFARRIPATGFPSPALPRSRRATARA